MFATNKQTTSDVLELALRGIKKSRRHYHDDDSIWELCSHLDYRIEPNTKLQVRQETVAKSIARVTRLYERQMLSKERLERHVQGFVRWAKGGLVGLIDSQNVEHVFRAALNQADIHSAALKHKSVLHNTKTIRRILWFGCLWELRR